LKTLSQCGQRHLAAQFLFDYDRRTGSPLAIASLIAVFWQGAVAQSQWDYAEAPQRSHGPKYPHLKV